MIISYYDLFDCIAEEAVDLLEEQGCNTEEITDNYQAETAINNVMNLISKEPTVCKVKPKRTKMWFLLAAVFIVMMSAISFGASNRRGAELITDLNRHLVGKNGIGSYVIIDAEGNIIEGELGTSPEDEVWKTSTVIKSVKGELSPPYSITEFSTKKVGDKYVTPEIIFDNGDMVIFTKGDGSGWKLKKGEKIELVVEEYPIEYRGKGQAIGYWIVRNGKLLAESLQGFEDTVDQRFEFVAERRGEYYICFMNGSSEPISLKEGKIVVHPKK